MNNKKVLLIAFVLIALAQLYVPANMVLQRNDILKTGKEFRFRTAPVDPYDPFRGKYISLNFSDTSFPVSDTAGWSSGETVFAVLGEDANGMARVKSIHRHEPEGTGDYLKTTVRYVSSSPAMVHLEYPFNRLYMEESKAYPAELAYAEASRDTTTVTCAVVNIKYGEAVLRDVLIDGVSVHDIVNNKSKNED